MSIISLRKHEAVGEDIQGERIYKGQGFYIFSTYNLSRTDAPIFSFLHMGF